MIEIELQKKLNTADGEILLEVKKTINNGEFLTLFGKSGSGKTTLLRIIAGLEKLESGKIVVDGEVWFDSHKKIDLSPQKRGVGFVFQDYALFPNMSVRENLTFALRDKKEIKKIDEILEMMEIQNLSNTKPERLSGGQKQRVALARALVSEPKILLLDEPLSALDNAMRLKLQEELQRVHEKFNITSILVSHDISEVFRLSSRVFKIEKGKIIADAKAEELFANQNTDAKFKLVGKILSIKKSDIIYIVELLANGEIVKVTALQSEIRELKIGDEILLSSKAFNPMIRKI